MEKVRVAFVGAGNTCRLHAAAFGDIESVELVGVCNRTLTKAQNFASEFSIKQVFSDVDEMIAATKPAIAVMAVYETAIETMITKLLAHDLTILMEKPLGVDLAAAKRVANTAANSKAQLYIGLNRRAYGATRATLNDLGSHDGPRYIHVQDQQSLTAAKAIGHDDTVVKNWMFANSIHLVDYLNIFGRGDITSVNILSPWTPDDPGIVLAQVKYSSGDTAIYEALWNGPGPWACTISTPTRRWELRPLEQMQFQNANERTLNTHAADSFDQEFKPGYRRQAEEIVRAYQGKPNDAVRFEQGLATTELIARIYSLNLD